MVALLLVVRETGLEAMLCGGILHGQADGQLEDRCQDVKAASRATISAVDRAYLLSNRDEVELVEPRA